MKKKLNSKYLPAATVGLGVAGLVLRWLLYALAVDVKNLLPRNHPLEILLWLITAAAALLIVVTVWKLDGSNRYVDNFGPSMTAAVGHFAAAAGILLTALLSGKEVQGTLAALWKALGVLSALAMVLAGISRMQGKRPLFLAHLMACAFFVIHMVGHYRIWSGNPQLQDYVFDLLGCVALMLFAFYEASFEVGSGRRRMHLATGLMAAYLGCVALSGSQYPLLYGSCAVWAITDLCTLTPKPRRQKPKTESEPKR